MNNLLTCLGITTLLLSFNSNHARALESTIVIISHPVTDYAAWKKVFDESKKNDGKAGLKELGVYKSTDNPNEVTVIFEVMDIEKAKAYFNDPKGAEMMKKSGVISKPEFRYLTKIE